MVHQMTWIKYGQYIDFIYSEIVFAKMNKIILIFLQKKMKCPEGKGNSIMEEKIWELA